MATPPVSSNTPNWIEPTPLTRLHADTGGDSSLTLGTGLGAVAAQDAPVVIRVPAAKGAGGLGAAAATSIPRMSQDEWRDAEWAKQERARRARQVREGYVYAPGTPAAQEAARVEASIKATPTLGAAAMGGTTASALQSALGEREGELGAIYDALANERFVTRTRANPLRPIVEQEAQIFEGGGPLAIQPFVPPPIEPGEDEWSYMQRVQALQEADVERQIQEAQTLGDVRDIGKSGHLGMREAQLQAAEGVGDAELAQAERVAQVQKEAAAMSAKATADARAADIERRDFARTQRDAIESVQAIQADAREKLQALPELDANRTFKSMDGGALFWSIIGNIAAGAMGSNQVNEALMARAQQDLDVQKANAAQAFDAAGAADAAVGQQMGLYRELLAAAGDEAAADAMFLQLQLDDASKMLEAQLAETTVPVLKAQLQESLVGLRQQIDQQEQAIQLRLATTPESFTTTTGSLGPRRRRLLEKRAEIKERERFELQKMAVEGDEKALDRAGRLKEKQAEVGKEQAHHAQTLAAQHAKDVAKMQAASKILGSFVNKARQGDIAGRGMDAYFATEEGRNVRETIKEGLRRQLRYESQGVIGEDEIEDRVESMESGWGDNEYLQNAERLINANALELEEREYGIGEEARKIYYRNPDLAPLPARGAGRPSGGVDADAAALGGRVVR